LLAGHCLRFRHEVSLRPMGWRQIEGGINWADEYAHRSLLEQATGD
jgi:hypothetical protein